MLANVLELGCVRLAKDQHGVLVPDEPDRARLRGQVAADRGEPDNVFAIEQLLGGATEFGVEGDHGVPPRATGHIVQLFCMGNYSQKDPECQDILVEKPQPGWRKLETSAQMTAAIFRREMVGLRIQYPNETEEKLKRRLAGVIYGEEFAERALGPVSNF